MRLFALDGDLSSSSSDVISGKAQATVQDYISVRIASSDVEQVLSLINGTRS